MTAVKFLERERAALRFQAKRADDRMKWYGRRMDRERTANEMLGWTRSFDRRENAMSELQAVIRLLRKARKAAAAGTEAKEEQ